MTAASIKPYNSMARLHLGCGESLLQLLPDAVTEQAKPVLIEWRRRQRKPSTPPARGGAK